MRTWLTRLIVLSLIVISGTSLLAGCLQGPKAASPAEFYAGKTITWVVSSVPGGSSDLTTRAVVPYLSKETGATVRVENLGTDEGVNNVYNESKPEGLTMVTNNSNAIISNDILKAPGVRYESEKFHYLADITPARKIFQISPKTPYRTLDAVRQAKGLRGGGTSARGALVMGAVVLTEILGLDAKVIAGFGGRKELTLGLGRGEADFMISIETGAKKDEQDGYVVNLFAVTDERANGLPDLPTMFELGAKVSKELEAAHKFVSVDGTAVAVAPAVPQERVDFLTKAFDKIGTNKDLQKDMEKVAGIWSPFRSGNEVRQTMATMKANRDLANQLDALYNKHKATQ